MPVELIDPPLVADSAKVYSLSVQALFERARQATMLAPWGTLFICWVERDVVALPVILAWALINSLPDGATFLLSTRLLRKLPTDERMPHWHNWQAALRMLQGLAWGSAVIFFHAEGAVANDLTVLAVLIAIAATSAVNMAPSFRTLVAFVASILFVPIAYYLWLGDMQHIQFAVGLLIMLGIVLQVGYDAYRQFTDGVNKLVLNQAISQQLALRNRQLAETAKQLQVIATHDELTGAYNRRYVVDMLERQRLLFKRHGTPCSIVLLDIDFFKQVNDRYGHAVGDEVLVAFVGRIEKILRQEDCFGRYGGEEFLLVLPETKLAEAEKFAQRIRLEISAVPLTAAPSSLSITASFGVAQLLEEESADGLLQRADDALYRAKANGRNCVVVADD